MNKLAPFAVLGCAAIVGCCVSYEGDVKKLCNLRETCPDPFEAEGLSRSHRERLIAECLATKLFTSEGRALFASLAGQPNRTQARLLSQAASKAELDSCPWVDELNAAVDVPPAPSACTLLSDDAASLEIVLSADSLQLGNERVLALPSREALEQGVGDRYLSKSGDLNIVPLSEALVRAAHVLQSTGKPVRVSVFASKHLHPMPVKFREQLLHTIRKAGIQDVRQVFLGTDQKLCSAPMS